VETARRDGTLRWPWRCGGWQRYPGSPLAQIWRERETERAMRVGQSERGRKGGVAAVLTMSRGGGDAQVRGGNF
jgi:hypothetical protein